ncbi:MAG: bifunctional riboflavin kinase/FAD synthetase [Pirellulales bacterium]
MKLIRGLADLPAELRSGAVAIGNFDGVHRGHARIVERLVAHARAVTGPAIVLTFDPHPVRILRPDKAPPPLTWTDRKAQLLSELGVDSTVVLATDEALLDLTADEFFAQIVRGRLDAKALVEGPNFYFGRGRQGTIDVLRTMTAAAGIELEVVEPYVLDGELVSSSRVRSLIAAGDVDRARSMLTHPYRIRGMVAHGAGRGGKLGFPTANVEAIDTLLPAAGVYAGVGLAAAGTWPAAINIGPNPTFGEHVLKVEAHLIGCHEPLYGQPLEIDFLSRIREVRTFSGVEALKQQLHDDVANAARIAGDWLRASG